MGWQLQAQHQQQVLVLSEIHLHTCRLQAVSTLLRAPKGCSLVTHMVSTLRLLLLLLPLLLAAAAAPPTCCCWGRQVTTRTARSGQVPAWLSCTQPLHTTAQP